MPDVSGGENRSAHEKLKLMAVFSHATAGIINSGICERKRAIRGGVSYMTSFSHNYLQLAGHNLFSLL